MGLDEQGPDIRLELSTGDGSRPAPCACLTDDTPHGALCADVRDSRIWPFVDDNGARRIRKHGGAPTCPRACFECSDGDHAAHHFCEIDMQPVFALDMSDEDLANLDESEREEIAMLRKHPAHIAGCESWIECRHCDAWIEASYDDGMGDDEDDADFDRGDGCIVCGPENDCECDDGPPDSEDFHAEEGDG